MAKKDWEQYVIDRLTERLEISFKRAQNMAESHHAEMMYEWSKGSTPKSSSVCPYRTIGLL